MEVLRDRQLGEDPGILGRVADAEQRALVDGQARDAVPRKLMLPARDGSRPMIVSMVVVFPAPLRPTRTIDSPWSTLSETPRSTCTCPRKVSSP